MRPKETSYWSVMFEITWRRSARDSFLNAVSRLRNLVTCVSSLSVSLFGGSASGRFDDDGGAVGRRCGGEWRACKMAPTRVILMSCGSYNPPTNMHLRMFGTYRFVVVSLECHFYRAANVVTSCYHAWCHIAAMRAACLSCLSCLYNVFLLTVLYIFFSWFFVPFCLMLNCRVPNHKHLNVIQ